MHRLFFIALVTCAVVINAGASAGRKDAQGQSATGRSERKMQVVTLGGGCFWCMEAVFEEVKGVVKVESGYSGGHVPDPTYKRVCTGDTGHAEVVQITFDPGVVTLEDLLRIFFTVHDPTTLNRQGADVGTQYRSVIFYRNEGQKKVAESVIREIIREKLYRGSIVTEVAPFKAFYKAEPYHQEYYRNNPAQPYCQIVISPKVAKFRKKFERLMKTR